MDEWIPITRHRLPVVGDLLLKLEDGEYDVRVLREPIVVRKYLHASLRGCNCTHFCKLRLPAPPKGATEP